MISSRDQAALRQRFQQDLASRVRLDFFSLRKTSIYVPGRDECVYCDEERAMLGEIAALSSRIALTEHDFDSERQVAASFGVEHVPAVVIRGVTNRAIRFLGLPGGVQFTPFVETIINASRGEVPLEQDAARQLKRLKSGLRLRLMVTPPCQFSSKQIGVVTKLALASKRITLDIIEVTQFPDLIHRYDLVAVPSLVIEDKAVIPGTIDEAPLLDLLLRVAEGRSLQPLTEIGGHTLLPPRDQTPQPRTLGTSGLVLPG